MKKEKMEPIAYQLADWFLTTKGLKTHEEIGQEILNISGKKELSYGDYASVIAQTRERLEIAHGLTLWNLRKEGYKIADSREFAFYTMGSVKKTLLYASRTKRLVPFVEKRFIPEAFKHVFDKTGHRVVSLASEAKRYLLEFDKMRKEKSETENKKEI